MTRHVDSGLDLLTASKDEILAAMRRGVRAALRRHKEAGLPVVVWDEVTKEIVRIPPEQIPDFPEADEEAAVRHDQP